MTGPHPRRRASTGASCGSRCASCSASPSWCARRSPRGELLDAVAREAASPGRARAAPARRADRGGHPAHPRGAGGPAGVDPRRHPRRRPRRGRRASCSGPGPTRRCAARSTASCSRAGWPSSSTCRGACSPASRCTCRSWAAGRARRASTSTASAATSASTACSSRAPSASRPRTSTSRSTSRSPRAASACWAGSCARPRRWAGPTSATGSSSSSCPRPGSARSTAW